MIYGASHTSTRENRLKVNGRDMKGMTREEAVLLLLGLQEQIELYVQHRQDEFERIRSQGLGDSFYIR